MAKDEKPKDDPKPWTPDQPLEDADDENEAQGAAHLALGNGGAHGCHQQAGVNGMAGD